MTAALLAGIVATSALGSVHCVAMCGPLVGMHGARSVRLAALHSLGRLITYTTIGALAGFAGSALDLAGRLGNVQRFATIVAGLAIVGWGVIALVQATRTRRAPTTASPARSTAFGSALVHIRTRRAARRMVLLGLLTGLLPCGWLWAFAITAAGTGAPLAGALVMGAFWLGTVPALVGLVGLAGPMILHVRARLPVVTACALIALGLATLGMRWRDAGSAQVAAPQCPLCHRGAL
jgi:sulfite exporter TauE/SafE